MSKNTSHFQVNLVSILTLVFIVLKLTGNIDWSWWWVLSPLWIPFGIFTIVTLACIVLAMIFTHK